MREPTDRERSGLDPEMGELDEELLAELEAEFAELEAEVDRINAMPVGWAQEQVDQLLDLQREWAARLKESGADKPEWRRRVETLLAGSIERIIKENHTVDLSGRLSLRPDTVDLTREAGPIFQALLPAIEDKLGTGLTRLLTKATEGLTQPFEANVKLPFGDLARGLSEAAAPQPEPAPAPTPAPPPSGPNVAPMHITTTSGRQVVVPVDLTELLESLAQKAAAQASEPAPSSEPDDE